MKKRTVFRLLGIAAAGAGTAGGLVALGNLLYSKAILPSPRTEDPVDRYDSQKEGRDWAREANGFHTITIPSSDGLTLWAALLPAARNEHRWVVCMHGYRDTHEAMGAIGKHYAQAGFNVLLPDQRGHGRSQGDYVGWGYDERLDVVGWINYIVRRDPQAQIVLHGVSMGAAAVLMATGGPLPEQVKAAVSDCSYTSIEPEMKHVLGSRTKAALSIPAPVPFSALFRALRKITLRRAGYDLRDASPIQAVACSKTPTLFIHGVEDKTVPPAMMGKLYQAARCPKSFLWVPEAGHAEAVGANPELYWAAVSSFLQKYLS